MYNQRSLRSEFTILELFEPRQSAAAAVGAPSPWQIFTSSFSQSRPGESTRFSSLQRAANGEPQSPTAALVPQILQRAYILASPVRSGAVAVSLTERGVTAKSLLCT